MLETRREFRLSGVPQQVHEPVALLVNQLTAALTDNLDSVTLIGSALTTDFHPRVSDINTVVVLHREDMAALRAVASLGKTLQKKRLAAPLLMTLSYIERSRDVFGIELLDFQLTHCTVLGEDPFATLAFARGDVRLQCERELKATLSRLRQGYIAAGVQKGLVQDLLIAAIKGLAPLLRALLWMKNIERPSTMEATFRKSGEVFAADLDHAIAVTRQRYESADGGDIESAFESVYAAIDELATRVDTMETA
jgi:hypothetical protein